MNFSQPAKIKKEDTEKSEAEHVKVESNTPNTTIDNKDTACNKQTAEATTEKPKISELNTTPVSNSTSILLVSIKNIIIYSRQIHTSYITKKSNLILCYA